MTAKGRKVKEAQRPQERSTVEPRGATTILDYFEHALPEDRTNDPEKDLLMEMDFIGSLRRDGTLGERPSLLHGNLLLACRRSLVL